MTNEELKAVKMAWARGEVVQYKSRSRWKDWLPKDEFSAGFRKWRIKPKEIRINGYDVPMPLTRFDGIDIYYIADISGHMTVRPLTYGNDKFDNILLSRGLCHATREAAELHAKALLSFTSKEEK